MEPPGPPRALPSARPRATLQGPALPRALQRRPSGALGGAAARVLEAPPSALDEGDISPSDSSSGLRKTSAAARGFKSRGEESGENRKKTVLGIGGEHHESLQTEFQFPDASERRGAAFEPQRPSTAPVPPRVDEVQATTRRLSEASLGRIGTGRFVDGDVVWDDDDLSPLLDVSGTTSAGTGLRAARTFHASVAKEDDVETAEDDSLRVVLPPKPPLPTLVDLEAAGDVLWAVYEKTECTAGVKKLNSDGTPVRVFEGNGDAARKRACASHLVLVASMVVHAGGLASREGWKQSDLRSKDVGALLNDAHALAEAFNELKVELRAPGALKSKTALRRENEAQRAAEIDQEVKEQRANPTFNRDKIVFEYYERDADGKYIRDRDGNLVRATYDDDGVNITGGSTRDRPEPSVVSPRVAEDVDGRCDHPWANEVPEALGGVDALKEACNATVPELFAPGAIGDLAAAEYFDGHGESTDQGRCSRAGTKSDTQGRDCIGIYCDNAELFYVQEEGLASLQFDPSAFPHLNPEMEEYKNRKLASHLVPFIRQGFVRYHVDSGHFVFAGPYWESASVLREARARDEEKSGVWGCEGRAANIRKNVPTLGSVIVVVMVKGVAHGCKLPASMWCKYGYNVMNRLLGGADLEAESEAARVKFAEAWAAQMQKCKAGKETRSIQIDLRSQFAKGDKRDEHYLHEPMDLGVLKPHVFESAEAVLAPSLPHHRSDTSSCPALYNFLVAADALVPGPTGGRLRSASGLRHFLSGEPSSSSVLFAADFRFRLGGGEWVRKEEWPGDQF